MRKIIHWHSSVFYGLITIKLQKQNTLKIFKLIKPPIITVDISQVLKQEEQTDHSFST